MSYLNTPFGVYRAKINRQLNVLEHKTSSDRYHAARRHKLHNPEKYQAEVAARVALGLPAITQKATSQESILRMNHGSKRKVTLPTIKF